MFDQGTRRVTDDTDDFNRDREQRRNCNNCRHISVPCSMASAVSSIGASTCRMMCIWHKVGGKCMHVNADIYGANDSYHVNMVRASMNGHAISIDCKDWEQR